jgi:hypothetical protein
VAVKHSVFGICWPRKLHHKRTPQSAGRTHGAEGEHDALACCIAYSAGRGTGHNIAATLCTAPATDAAGERGDGGGEGAPADEPRLGRVARLLQTLKSFGSKGDTEDDAPVAPARRRGSMDLPAAEAGTREGRAFAAGSRRGSMELPGGADAGGAERKAGAMGCRRDCMDTSEGGRKAAACPEQRRASLQIAAGGSRAPAAQARLAAAAFDAPDRCAPTLPPMLVGEGMPACCHGAVCFR